MRAVSIESDANCPTGLIGEAAVAAGYELQPIVVDRRERAFDVDPSGIDLLIVTGSEEHWHEIDEHRHLQVELEWIQAAMQEGARVLGLCFGGQALALALGGDVQDSGALEIGWISVDSDDPGLVAPGPWFAWHHDTFTVPAGGRLVASNEVGPHAFRHGPHLGLQFHPELTVQMLAGWLPDAPGWVDRDDLMEETLTIATQARRRAFDLFDAFERLGVHA